MRPKQISSGFRVDMETLFSHFLSYDVKTDEPTKQVITIEEVICLRFSRFARIWRELDFEFIFNGRQAENELREFIDEIYIEVVSQLTNEKAFGRRVASLYLLYCLYVKQPIPRNGSPISIRINFFYLKSIRELVESAKQLEQFDVCYVWYKLLSLSAIHFIHVLRPMGPFYIRNSRVTSEAESLTDHFISQFRGSVMPHMDDLSNIHEQYRIMKEALAEDSPNDMNTINQVEDNIFEVSKVTIDNLQKQFSTVYDSEQLLAESSNEMSDEFNDTDETDHEIEEDIGSRRRKIKNKSMSQNASVVVNDSNDQKLKRKRTTRSKKSN